MTARHAGLLGSIAGLMLCVQAQGQEVTKTTTTLARLAEKADLIAIVRVDTTQYEKTRSFPSRGFADLRVLIPYKGIKRDELVAVTEEGLDADACYYPEVGPFVREGQRFLVFLKKASKSVYVGRAPGCRIPVLVSNDSQYAMVYPIPGVTVSDLSLVEELTFSDPAAFVDATESTFAQKDELTSFYQARLVEPDNMAPGREIYVYTRGIPITSLRNMMSSQKKN
jgi:hypothetical protein